jgi:tRNA 2-selenouridine synthase
MAITKIPIQEFLQLSKTNLVLDVRSPSEYAHAHMPHAQNLPLFNDEERKIVGTAYKQQSKQIAIKLGLDFFGTKMREMVEEVEQLAASNLQLAKSKAQKAVGKQQLAKGILQIEDDYPAPTAHCILVHCWRGGMRSAGVAWLLDLYGFKVYTLEGGYKAYRNWVLQQFEKEYHFKIIGGYTGSGKTLLLDALAKENNAVIDLEGLANHKGSALGALGQLPQPTQEMFENLLATELEDNSRTTDDRRQTTDDRQQTTDDRQQTTDDRQQTTDNGRQTTDDGQHKLLSKSSNSNEPIAKCPLPTAHCIWLEDESQRIGNLQIPMPLWYTMRSSKVYFFDIPFEERLNYLTEEYGVQKKDGLVNAIMRIQKRLGGLETKTAINFLLENNFKESFRILLTYYDKYYLKGLYNRENTVELIKTIISEGVDVGKNIKLLFIKNC